MASRTTSIQEGDDDEDIPTIDATMTSASIQIQGTVIPSTPTTGTFVSTSYS